MQKSTNRIFIAVACAVCASCFAAPANAHEIFAETLEAHYGLKSVTCKTCHPDNKDRTIHNEFGHLVVNAVAGKDISRRMADAEAAGDEALEAMEAEVAAEFLEVLPAIEAVQFTTREIFLTGMMNGTKLTDEAEVTLQEGYAAAAEEAGGGAGEDGGAPGEDGGAAEGGGEATETSGGSSNFLSSLLIVMTGAFGLALYFKR